MDTYHENSHHVKIKLWVSKQWQLHDVITEFIDIQPLFLVSKGERNLLDLLKQHIVRKLKGSTVIILPNKDQKAWKFFFHALKQSGDMQRCLKEQVCFLSHFDLANNKQDKIFPVQVNKHDPMKNILITCTNVGYWGRAVGHSVTSSPVSN